MMMYSVYTDRKDERKQPKFSMLMRNNSDCNPHFQHSFNLCNLKFSLQVTDWQQIANWPLKLAYLGLFHGRFRWTSTIP